MLTIPTLRACDVLALGPHPDDVEIAVGGTILLLRAAGRTVTVVDFTRGEMGSRGSVADRATEGSFAALRTTAESVQRPQRFDQRVGLLVADKVAGLWNRGESRA